MKENTSKSQPEFE